MPEMAVRLFDGDDDVTSTGRGQPACRGPATCLGYLGGGDHDKLFTPDGWMRMGDICEIDAEGQHRNTLGAAHVPRNGSTDCRYRTFSYAWLPDR